MMGSHIIMNLIQANLQVHFPATLQAAEGIPGDNASGMDKTNIFASGSTQGPEDVHRKV